MTYAHKERPSEEWREDALCSDVGPSLFFPEEANYKLVDEQDNPGAFCLNCSVKTQCLEYAIIYEIRHGVFGGTNEVERNRLINQRIKLRRTESRIKRRGAQS